MKRKPSFLALLLVFGILGVFLCSCSSESSTDSTESADPKIPSNVEAVCRAMTKNFVEDLLEEDYSMLAFNVSNFDLDENQNGTIDILYLPSNAGDEGATKIDLTIAKSGSMYTVEYALLAGMYEVDLSQFPAEHLTFMEQ